METWLDTGLHKPSVKNTLSVKCNKMMHNIAKYAPIFYNKNKITYIKTEILQI